MRLAAIRGTIDRRILVNFRVDPEVMQRQLPAPFRPKLLGNSAVAGICLLRLEQVRPAFVPLPIGLASENAAHRVAVRWTDEQGEEREGVYIPRRDSGAWLNQLMGGRLFPGTHGRAEFRVRERGGAIDLAMRSEDGAVAVQLRARPADELPSSSRFGSLAEASAFFAAGSQGYSATAQSTRLDGVCLRTEVWQVAPLAVEEVHSSFFSDSRRFPAGSVEFDCALIMRSIPSYWQALDDLSVGEPPDRAPSPLAAVG